MDIKFFVAILSSGHASLATSGKRNWQPGLRSRGFRTASCLDAAGGRWGMGMSSMAGIGQGWDVLREPGLGKVYAPI